MEIKISTEQIEDKELLKKIFTEEFIKALEEENSKSKPKGAKICIPVPIFGVPVIVCPD